MARIDALPSLEIIRGLKGILDFYVWRGLPCVRAWPKYRPAKQTAASLAAALVFGAIVKSYSLLGDVPLEAYREDAKDQPRTARDIMVTGVYGNLHEASMSNFLDLLVECRDFLSDLTALLNALDSVDTDEIVVNVDQSVLPTGAATQATLATLSTEAKLEAVRVLLASLDGKDFSTQTTLGALLTELQLKADLAETQPISAAALPLPAGAATAAAQALALTQLEGIEDLTHTLQTVAANRLLVRGSDQLFSFDGVIAKVAAGVISGAGGFFQSDFVPAGYIWVITTAGGYDSTTPPTAIEVYNWHDAATILLGGEWRAFAINESWLWSGHTFLDSGDRIRVYFQGGLAGDTCGVFISGYRMTKET